MSDVVKEAIAVAAARRVDQEPRVDLDRDKRLRGELPMPESPTSTKPIASPADVDRFRSEAYEVEQQVLREQEQVRELKRTERRQQAAMLVTIEAAGRTYQVRVPPELVGAGGLEGGLGQTVGRLVNAGQCWSFYALQTAEREALDPVGFEHGKVWVAGRQEACPCRTKSCTFRAEAMSWKGQFEQTARELGALGLLEETK